jgi:FkbM family methyltransferase
VLRRRMAQMRKLFRLLLSSHYRRGLRKGVAAAIEHEVVLAPLAVRTVIDIGANIGQFSLLARQLYPASQVFAFEPLLQPAERYRQLFCGDALVTLFPYGIGSDCETRRMHVSNRQDSSSLLPITQAQERFAPGTGEIARENVIIKPLKDALGAKALIPPVLLKLDVQGFELEALKGCKELLPNVTFVYVEVSFMELYAGQAHADDVVRFLFESGFSLAGANEPSYDRDGRCVQVDLLFRRQGV